MFDRSVQFEISDSVQLEKLYVSRFIWRQIMELNRKFQIRVRVAELELEFVLDILESDEYGTQF